MKWIWLVLSVILIPCITGQRERIKFVVTEYLRCEESSNGFSITCNTSAQPDWSKLPDCKTVKGSPTKRYDFIRFEGCSFPPGFKITNLTNSFEITANEFQFINSTSKITRDNLEGQLMKKLYFSKAPFNVSQDLLYDLEIEQLKIVKSIMDDIPENFFQNSSGLRELEFWSTTLMKIWKKDFSHLKNLTELTLSINNKLREIESGAFDNLIALQRFGMLGNSKLRTLPSGLFKNLENLEELTFQSNVFDSLPSDLLDIKGPKLKKIWLTENKGKLSALPDGFFKNLDSLRQIKLNNNYFTSVPENLFAGLRSLLILEMRNNRLTELPPKLFESTSVMRILDLSNNRLESLDEKVFETMVLDQLNLDNNRFKKLSSSLEMSYLRVLTLSGNELDSIDDQFCKKATVLRKLDLSNNKLTLDKDVDNLWSKDLSYCDSLTELNLSNNTISKFPFWDSYSLREGERRTIILQNNAITDMNYNIAFGYLGKDIEVKLEGNNLSTIDFEGIHESSEDDWLEGEEVMPYDTVIDITNAKLICDCKLINFVKFIQDKLDDRMHIAYRYLKFNFKNVTCRNPPGWENRSIYSIAAEDLGCEVPSCSDVCSCSKFPGKNLLVMNCANKNLTSVDNIFLGFENKDNYNIELNLSGNRLKETPAMNRKFFQNVTSLDLSNNQISKVTLDLLSDNLQILKLHDNLISRLSDKVIYRLKGQFYKNLLTNLTLHNNRWICDCKAMGFIKFVTWTNSKYQFHRVFCYDLHQKVVIQNHFELCWLFPLLIILSIAILGAIFGALAAFYYKNNKKIKIWLYSKQWCLWLVTEDELDKDKEYDAFISFSHKDETFVNEELVEKLEKGPKPYKLCLHYRDWLAGEWIPAQIAHSVEESRRTIIVLSPNFMESVWGRMEFRTAHNQALSEGRARVIVILYGDIGSLENLDSELKAYLSMNTYIEWGDPWFWDKLRYALPHKHERSRYRKRNIELIEKQLEHLEQIPLHNHNDNQSEKTETTTKNNDSSNQEAQSLLV